MECVSPIYINHKGQRMFVPCGKCNYCLSRRRNDWTFRLKNEQKNSYSAHFITLTYSDENYPGDGKLNKRHLQLFLKRLRAEQGRSIDKVLKRQKNALKWPSVKYYACGEYGTKTKRAHYHVIIFNIHPSMYDKVLELWGLGHVVVVPSNVKTIHYTTKYVINNDDPNFKGFALMSKGLGDSYSKNQNYHVQGRVNFVINDGYPMAMPRYYRDKFFTRVQRQIIAKKTERSVKERYESDLVKLSRFHPNPERYAEERKQADHESIKSKINKKNTF